MPPETTRPRPAPPAPWPQRLLDDIWLMLAAGLIFPTLFYIVWGLISLASVPALPG